jgi:hypothetical protein
MLLNVVAHKLSIQNVKVSKCERHIRYSVTKLQCHKTLSAQYVIVTKNFVTVYVLWRCWLCDVFVLKTLSYGTLTLCAAKFCNFTSCDVYVMLLYVT